MTPDPATDSPAEEPELAPYKIETARSSRSKCRTCRRKIDKDVLRLGVLLEGPYGTGYLWHHLTCAAKRRAEDVEEAYAAQAWEEGVKVPPIDELRKLKEKAEEKKANKKEAPYLELAPTARSKCKHCEEPVEKGAYRFTLLREVTFGNQVRATPINVHARCVIEALDAEDCLTELEGFGNAVRANSRDVSDDDIQKALAETGVSE